MTDILKILKGYRTRYSFNDGDSLELVDMLCHDDADDITDGLLELEALAEGRQITGTGNHLIYTVNRGWAEYLYDELPDHADLTAKLKLAVEALEHYANNAHWDEYEDEFNGESGWYSIFNKTVDFGNKVAEAALKQIGEPAKGRDI